MKKNIYSILLTITLLFISCMPVQAEENAAPATNKASGSAISESFDAAAAPGAFSDSGDSAAPGAFSDSGDSSASGDSAVSAASTQRTGSSRKTTVTSRSSSDFYQKLKKGSPVRIAILGDSIADKTGVIDPAQAWDSLLFDWLNTEFTSRITQDNYAIGGTISYTGYYQCETAMRDAIKKNGSYDLVIICYGQNDAPENFVLFYEGLLRTVKKLNRSCQLITILESSQQIYTEKMQEIIRLSGLYGADIADTISAYALSGLSYEQLCADDIHPNAPGHAIYFDTVRSVIESNMAEGKKITALPASSSPFTTLFENFTFIPLSKCKTEDGQYRLVTNAPSLGIVYKKFPGGSDIRLEFSTGEVWADTGNTTVLKEWTMAAPIGLLVGQGTVVTLDNADGMIENTVIGFISSGYLPVP